MVTPHVQVKVSADTSSAVASLKDLVSLARSANAALAAKPGYRTTEFWVVLLTFVASGVSLVWHRDFSGYVQAAAVVSAGLASAVYALSRAHLKKPTSLASALYDLNVLRPQAQGVATTVGELVSVLKDVPSSASLAVPDTPVPSGPQPTRPSPVVPVVG